MSSKILSYDPCFLGTGTVMEEDDIVMVLGCLLLISWTTFGCNCYFITYHCNGAVSSHTSTATGPWWLKTMVNILFLL